MQTYIYSKHAMEEALRNNPKSIEMFFLLPQFDDPDLKKLISVSGAKTKALPSGKMPAGADPAMVRNGIFASMTSDRLMQSYKGFIERLAVGPDTCLLLLDEIQDPHNVGAIIRSAAAFGAAAILLPENNQAGVTDTVVKVSAGMAFRVPLVSIGNVNITIRDLKESGFWIYGMDASATHNMPAERFDAPAVFVLGNEASGIRQKTRELCDVLLSIPMNKRCESLNVSASTAVALYAWSSQHPGAL